MDRRLLLFFGLLAPVVIWSWIAPHDRFTWWLEAAPVVAGGALILVFRKKFPLTTLLLALVWVHCVILLVGAHYTYARVPLFDWLRDLTGGARNNYDKLGHFAQGFVPALLAREILLRTSPLGRRAPGDARPSRWLAPLVVSVCLAFSAFYELVEWAAALLTGAAAEDFLGTQGDPWDTQSDMALALVGAVVALLALSRLHDRGLRKIANIPGNTYIRHP
ncbi:membrane protein [Opitutaceae bacterium TAV5]|nr:membrane protein [Opitutaceae bacterium TAV5]